MAGLSWEELPQFYRAELAFRHFQCDWATFGFEVWHAIWSDAICCRPDWHALSPEEQNEGDFEDDDEARVGTDDILDTGDETVWFGRVFTNEKWTLCACILADPVVGFRIRVSCKSSRKKQDANFSTLPATDDSIGWVSSASSRWRDREIQFENLKTAAHKVMEMVDSHLLQCVGGVRAP